MISNLMNNIARGGWKSRVAAAAVVVAALFVLAIVVDAGLSYNRIHAGVSIAGIDVGRLTHEEAAAKLTAKVQQAATKPITLTSATKDRPVLPKDVGTVIDVSASVDKAASLGRGGNIVDNLADRFALYVSPRTVGLSGTVDSVLLDTLIAGVAEKLDKPPVNAGVVVKGGEVSVVEGTDGLVVDQAALRGSLKSILFSLHSTELPVPTKVLAPAIQAANTSTAVAQVKTMIGAGVKLKLGDQTWNLSSEKVAAALEFRTEGQGSASQLVPFLSAKKLSAFLKSVGTTVTRAPKSATWQTDGNIATLVAARTGRKLDTEATAAALTAAALKTSSRAATALVKESQPTRSTEKAKSMGVVAKIGSYTTEFSGSAGRLHNVARAGEIISGTLVAPGEQFDFNTVVGARTEANGFKTAPAIIGGKLEDTLGGGICQVSTTLFNAVFFAGLDVTARTNHSIYISHYPKGRDATVSWGGPEFRFRNDTPNWILIKAATGGGSLTFVLYGTPQHRKVTYTTSDFYNISPPTEKRVKTDRLFVGATSVTDDGQTGKQVKVVRKVVQDGKTIHNDIFVSSYPMRPKVIEEGTKAKVTTTSTTTKPKPKPTTTTTSPPSSSTTTTTTP
jgi:vancomycin resistance protein YoaR